MTTASLIEALLFSRAEPWGFDELAKALGKDESEVREGVSQLEENMRERGLCVLRTDTNVTLGTHPEAHALLQQLYKEDLQKGLSKASIETLSIIMYGTEITRGKIDYIRGVNSGFILRSLLVRGLIERKPYPHDRKSFMYVPSVELLAQFGVATVESLPEYERIHGEIDKSAIGAEITEEKDGTVSESTDA